MGVPLNDSNQNAASSSPGARQAKTSCSSRLWWLTDRSISGTGNAVHVSNREARRCLLAGVGRFEHQNLAEVQVEGGWTARGVYACVF